ncbi:hypothetical protein CDAR_2261 [Caerostris darwini]|uniref:Uncharacterized protein n=1 Tax=Caerostris darwini TaxID=1538125 RepID=A0AAV4ND83_9ARAC|nr:hypothetical protein CDAR_2261 [Caerostris darwini]
MKEMNARCANLRISHNDVSMTINDLKERVEYLHMAKQANTTPAPNRQHQQTTVPPNMTDEQSVQSHKLRIPPFFVRLNANWIINQGILKRAAPSMKQSSPGTTSLS